MIWHKILPHVHTIYMKINFPKQAIGKAFKKVNTERTEIGSKGGKRCRNLQMAIVDFSQKTNRIGNNW